MLSGAASCCCKRNTAIENENGSPKQMHGFKLKKSKWQMWRSKTGEPKESKNVHNMSEKAAVENNSEM